jgi:ribonuclease P/MRP protein subunit RPP20
MAGAQAVASRRKRPPGRLFTNRNDVYVGRNSNYRVQLERCQRMLEKECSEITIHGLGAAVNRAIHLALSLEERSLGSLRVRLININFILNTTFTW